MGTVTQKKIVKRQKRRLSVQLYDMENDISEIKNVQDKYPEIVKEQTQLLTKYIKEGRSTKGANQTNEGPRYWKQLTWLKE